MNHTRYSYYLNDWKDVKIVYIDILTDQSVKTGQVLFNYDLRIVCEPHVDRPSKRRRCGGTGYELKLRLEKERCTKIVKCFT